MINITAKILLHDNQNATPPTIVDKIAGDTACIISFGGGGILNYNYADKLAAIMSNEILRDVGDVPNYALFWDGITTNDMPFLRANERLLFERKGKNFLPKDSSIVYISEKNINSVFRQRIRPLVAMRGAGAITTLNFVVDGNVQNLTSLIKEKARQIATDMNFNDAETREMTRHVSTHVFSYSKYFTPQYLNDLFNQILLPRITDDNGARLPLDIAMQRVRKMNIFSHCYGSYVALMLEEIMQNKMHELGYSEAEANQIQSQLLIVALNPSCPLGVSKSQFISFISGYDDKVMRPDNWASEFVNENRESEIKRINQSLRSHEWVLKPGFLSKQNGNVFFVKQRFDLVDSDNGKTIGWNEHNNNHYASRKFTDDGKLLATLARNILVTGVKNSVSQSEQFTPLPPLEELILDGKNDEKLTAEFKNMVKNGKEFMRDAYKYALTRIQSRLRTSRGLRNNKEGDSR